MKRQGVGRDRRKRARTFSQFIEMLELRQLLSNVPPVALDDVLPVKPGGPAVTIDPTLNDSDADGDTITVTGFTSPLRGSVTRSGNLLTYTPALLFQGFDSFNYTISDGAGHSVSAEVKVASGVALLGGDWSTFGGNAQRTGYKSGYVGSAEPIDGWTLAAGETQGWPVSVGQGRVYVTDQDTWTVQEIRALNPINGSVIWEQLRNVGDLGDNIEQPTYYNGRIYVRSGVHSNSQMLAMNAATGDLVWQAANSTQWDTYTAPAVSDIGVWGGGGYYGGMQGWNLSTGTQINFIYGPQIDGWGPSIDGSNVYRVLSGHLYKYDSAGTQLWSVSVAHSGNVPVLAMGRVYLASTSGLTVFSETDGSTVWTAGGSFTGNAAVASGRVYAFSGATIKSFDANNGAAIKTYSAPAGQTLANQPIVTDDALIAASSTNTFIFSLASGELLYTLPVGGKLALADNRLYISKSDGGLATYVFASQENQWPVAQTDAATTPEETAININVISNDSDPDGDAVSLRSVTTPAHGTAVVQNGGIVRYTPALNFFGTDTFTYLVTDERGGKATGTVTVTVTPVNDPPTAPPLTIYVPTDKASQITVNGDDVDGDPLTVTIVAPPLNGTLSGGSGPSFTYTPNPGFSGGDSFTYSVSDGIATSKPGLVTVYVDDAPTVEDTTGSVYEDASGTIALKASDPNGDPLVYSVIGAPANGTYTISGRYLTYRPKADFHGTDTLTYRAFDGIAYSSNIATLTITVVNTNDWPIAKPDSFAVRAGATTISGDVLANDTDVDSDPLTITSFTQPAHGHVQRFGPARFQYTPDAGFTGLDQFNYTISDGSDGTSTTSVSFSVGTPQLNGDWTTFGNGSAHTGYFPGSVLGGTFVAGWSATMDSQHFFQPVIAEGRVYLVAQSYFGAMYASALDVKSGNEIWRHTFAAGHGMNPATYYNGRLYLQRGNHGSDTQLWALTAQTGDTIWSAPFSAQWETYYAPAVHSSGIWIDGGYYGGMYGFKHDGTSIAFVSQQQYDQWTPSILGDNVYSYVAGGFTKYDLSGNLVWTNTKSWNWSGWSMNRTTALAGNSGYIIGNPDLYSVDLTTGKTNWTVAGSFSGTPAVANGVVYAISGQTVNAYDASTGALVRTYSAPAGITSLQPIVTDDSLLVTTGTQTLVFHLASGTLIQEIDRSGLIALANGALYISASDGGLYTYKLTSPPTTAPSAPDLESASDSGASDADNLTRIAKPAFTGSAASGAAVSLFADGVQIGSTTAGPDGTWRIVSASGLADGLHEIVAVTFDGAGSSGRSSPALSVTIDTTPPAPAVHFDVNAHRAVLSFGEPVSPAPSLAQLTLTDQQTHATITPASASYDPATFTLSVGFAQTLPNGSYHVSFDATALQDEAGNTGSVAAAGDFFVLAADANRDGVVDVSDLGILALNWQGTGKTFAQGDFNYDGMVDVTDLGILATNWQKSLPAPSLPIMTRATVTSTSISTSPARTDTTVDRPSRHSLVRDVLS